MIATVAVVVNRNAISVRERGCGPVRLRVGDAFVGGPDASLDHPDGVDPSAAFFCN